MRRLLLAKHGQPRHNPQIVERHLCRIYLSPRAIYKHGCLEENDRHDVCNVMEDILTQAVLHESLHLHQVWQQHRHYLFYRWHLCITRILNGECNRRVVHRFWFPYILILFTTRKRSFVQGNIFTSVSHSVYRGVCIQLVCIQGGSASKKGLHPGGGSASRGSASSRG